MSRVPPGGNSTICFGDPVPVKRVPSAGHGLDLNGGMADDQKAAILELVGESSGPEELIEKITDKFRLLNPNQVCGDMAGPDDTPVHLTTSRGFKPATAKVENAVLKLRESLTKRGCDSIMRLAKRFGIMDDDGSRGLAYDELKKGILETSCELDEGEIQALFRFVDSDCSGYVSFDEFLSAARGEMNERRVAMVMQAFKVMDVNNDGALTTDDLAGRYDVSRHPDVISGVASENQVLGNFLMGFDGTLGVKTKIVTRDRFAAYYSNISASVDDDDYFELMIRNCWHISGGEGAAENTTCRRLLVTHGDGTTSVEEIENDIDVSRTDLAAMKQNLRDQGLDVTKISLYGDFSDCEEITTSSPKKRPTSGVAPTPYDGGEQANAYKNRMSASSVTFA